MLRILHSCMSFWILNLYHPLWYGGQPVRKRKFFFKHSLQMKKYMFNQRLDCKIIHCVLSKGILLIIWPYLCGIWWKNSFLRIHYFKITFCFTKTKKTIPCFWQSARGSLWISRIFNMCYMIGNNFNRKIESGFKNSS